MGEGQRSVRFTKNLSIFAYDVTSEQKGSVVAGKFWKMDFSLLIRKRKREEIPLSCKDAARGN